MSTSTKRLRWPRALGYLAVLFAVSVGVNYVWEMAQMPLYQDMPFDNLRSWLLCFRASLGDGVIILAIWALGFLIFRERYWFAQARSLLKEAGEPAGPSCSPPGPSSRWPSSSTLSVPTGGPTVR